MKKIMAVNAGSSSLKFKLFEMPFEKVIVEGSIERIGMDDAIYTIKLNGGKDKAVLPILNHSEAVNKLLKDLVERNIVGSLEEIAGVGHRVVQGGWYFSDSVVIDNDVKAKISELSSLAPLHNPANLIGIEAFQRVLPDVPNVAIFDTSFHQTMEPEAYMYALPYDWYEELKVRKYGFHGASHKYVSLKVAEVMNRDIKDLKIITCHLGNGVSLAAIKNGICIDTTMGLTPLEGIPMGTRSGNIDPGVLEYVSKKKGYSLEKLMSVLNKESGYYGVSGISNDSRDLVDAAAEGNKHARLALDIQYKRIADYIGSYYVYMEGVDAIVFTAGIGENNDECRTNIINRIKVLGVEVNEANNKARGVISEISTKESKVKVYLIPTDEELMIARDVIRLT